MVISKALANPKNPKNPNNPKIIHRLWLASAPIHLPTQPLTPFPTSEHEFFENPPTPNKQTYVALEQLPLSVRSTNPDPKRETMGVFAIIGESTESKKPKIPRNST